MTLDIIMKNNAKKYLEYAGGSMGNVLSILSYFGWSSYPISLIGNDRASDVIIKDIKQWKVNTDYIFREDYISTPIIIENINDKKRINNHTFKFICPLCSAYLPKLKILPKDYLSYIINDSHKNVNVFYIDRLSKPAVLMAKHYKEKGALIFFEPHKIYKETLFKELLNITDIIKYSSEKIKDIPFERSVGLEIQTLGINGLNYSFKSNKATDPIFTHLNAYNKTDIIDAAGAGDWLTAGLIDKICKRKNLYDFNTYEIQQALTYGQILASIKCNFEGARGMMYSISKRQLSFYMNQFLNEKNPNIKKPIELKTHNIRSLCPKCK